MRIVQRREIAAVNELRAALAAGRTDSASLAARISVAEANLADMEGAIDGAENRAEEFTQARAAIAEEPGSGNIDGELSELQNRIAQMRAVADDLSNNI
jgi:chromosome segregation ATPase